jgi:serralysin
VGIDQIVLENSIFTKLTAIGTLSDDFFHVGAGAADLNDFIIYDDTTGALYYDSNGSAAGQQVQFAHLDPGLSLTHTDFFVV